MSTEKVVEATNNIEPALIFAFDKMETYFEAAKQIIETYGGDVATLGLNVLRIEAASELVMPIIVIGIISCFYSPLKKFFAWIKDKQAENPDDVWFFLYAVHISVGIAFTIFLTKALNLWAWVGIFYPELYAVHKFILP